MMFENSVHITGDGSEKGTVKGMVISTCEAVSYAQDSDPQAVPDLTQQEEQRLWRKVDMRLMPIMTVMYLCSFVDRGNIGTSSPIHIAG